MVAERVPPLQGSSHLMALKFTGALPWPDLLHACGVCSWAGAGEGIEVTCSPPEKSRNFKTAESGSSSHIVLPKIRLLSRLCVQYKIDAFAARRGYNASGMVSGKSDDH